MKYQCNVCGKIYTWKSEAALCHPDVIEVEDEKELLTEAEIAALEPAVKRLGDTYVEISRTLMAAREAQ